MCCSQNAGRTVSERVDLVESRVDKNKKSRLFLKSQRISFLILPFNLPLLPSLDNEIVIFCIFFLQWESCLVWLQRNARHKMTKGFNSDWVTFFQSGKGGVHRTAAMSRYLLLCIGQQVETASGEKEKPILRDRKAAWSQRFQSPRRTPYKK